MKTISAFACLIATCAAAQANSIQVESLAGAGTVVVGSTAKGVSPNMQLQEKALVTATKGSRITIKFPSGCTATVTDAAPFVVSEENCKALLALNKSTPAWSPTAANVGLIAAGAAGVALIAGSKDDKKPISPR